jgi:hypothetical protein
VTIVPFLLFAWPFLIPIVAALCMTYLCWTRGGDPEQDSATVQYEPPENLTPAECGALLDNAVAPRSITATIVDLSVKGFFTIEPKEGGKAAAPEKNCDYTFHLLKPTSDWTNLKPHEHAVLGAIFLPMNPLRMLADAMSRIKGPATNTPVESLLDEFQATVQADPRLRALSEAKDEARDTVTLSESQNFFYMHKAELSTYIFSELIAGGYYGRRPDKSRQFYLGVGILSGVLLILAGSVFASPATPWIVWILSGALTSAIILGFGALMPARTIAGARALGKVRGFADFLGRVEKDQIERVEKTPQLFEKYLPYAMALGVENKWAQSFGRITVQPKWHGGQQAEFLPMQMVENLRAMPNQTGQAMAPSNGAT